MCAFSVFLSLTLIGSNESVYSMCVKSIFSEVLVENVCKTFAFSSSEPKAQVSFSDQNLSVVRRCRCCRRCRKLSTFSSSSPEPLGQFQQNLAQCILFPRGDICENRFMQLKKSSSPEPLSQFEPNLAQSILG